MNQLKVLGVRVIFDGEHLDTANTDTDVIISVTEAIAQAVQIEKARRSNVTQAQYGKQRKNKKFSSKK